MKTDTPPQLGSWVLRGESEDMPPNVYDGDEFLVAVAVRDHADNAEKWHYEYAVVTARCDEHFFGLTCNDETWGWDWTDVEFYVRLQGKARNLK